MRILALALAMLGTILAAPPAEAYIGPGAGFAVLSSFLVLLLSFLLALASLLLWPFRLLLKALRGRRTRRPPVDRVVILGLDGLDPTLTQHFLAQGLLPHFARLQAQGAFAPLATSYPSISPAAWSSFMTGVDCSYHNIFDFLSRDPRTYRPVLSSTAIRPPRTLALGPLRLPLGRPRVTLLRKSRPFWHLLGDHGIWSSVIRVPITFPPEKFHGCCLSGMCAPDLRGSQGTFAYYTTNHALADAKEGGLCVPVTRHGDSIRTVLHGPEDALHARGGYLSTPLTFRLDDAAQRVHLEVSGQRLVLAPRQYSPRGPVTFPAAPGLTIHGICRFYLNRLAPDFDLYVTPVQIDPERPAMPISHPVAYSVYLAKLLDRFGTLGLAEDTWALNEGVIDEQAFLDQAWLYFAERERQFLAALDTTRRGLTVCVFDTSDRIQHMFFRTLDPTHPANHGRDPAPYQHVIADMYQRMDALVGRTLARLGPRDVLLVLSDHGFSPFRRGVNINTWLLQHGYLALQPGHTTSGEWFAAVDWSRTRAYCLGLTGLFINRKGREGQGIVDDGPQLAALKAELVARLSGLVDPDRGDVAIREVLDTAGTFRGPYLDGGPDLLLGYNHGYRTSWECAAGKVSPTVFADNTRRWSGDHCIDPKLVPGVLFSNRPLTGRQPDIRDLAPTVLSLFGVPVPPYMEGQSLISPSVVSK